ncbi:MAG: ABC transporter permease [Lewinellaceae bacterium]|nr:ABC transporter permease [Lewinellaceae bacterium]
MFQHNLALIYRNFKRFKSTFLINLLGLSAGLACTFLIYLWISDEVGFDKFHTRDAQLFQVMEWSAEGGKKIVHDATQGLLGQSMAKDLPEVESAVSVLNLAKYGQNLPFTFGGKSVERTGIFATHNFFEVFSFKLKSGQPAQLFLDRNAVVISEKMAQSLFGSAEAALGKTLDWEVFGKKRQSQVSGVFENPPANNSLIFDFVGSYDMCLQEIWTNGQKWWNEGTQTYLVLKPDTNIPKFNEKIADFIKRYRPETIFTCFVRPYSSAYLHGKYVDGVQAGGRIAYVRLFSIIALFILLIACINFMNLSTAKASVRVKEIGIKKAVGSSRGNLVAQLLGEALAMSALATVLALGLTAALLPLFNSITGKAIVFPFSPQLIAIALGVALLTGFLAGSYPAFYLSRFRPVAVLKGKIERSSGELLARRGLVVFQFMVSLVLIFAVAVIYRQLDFIQSKNLGYDRSNVLYFDKVGTVSQNPEAFLAEIRQIPGVERASSMQETMVESGGTGGSSTYGIEWPGKTEKDLIDFNVRAVDFGMIELLEMPLAAGRSFSREFSDEGSQLLFNETAIRAMGLKNPVGQPVKMWGEQKIIAGVVKDFHLTSLHEPIAPMVFRFSPEETSTVVLKIKAGDEKATLERLGSFYKKFNPGFDFNFRFLDETYQAQYVSERRVSQLSRYFAGLAILISCLGLFGLSMFTAEQRKKEIGIRKVLGASVVGITSLLAKDFLKLVVIAIVIASPLAWWAMNQWLAGFAYHIDIQWWMFVVAGAGAVAVAFLTVGFQSMKAALANPVKSLKVSKLSGSGF